MKKCYWFNKDQALMGLITTNSSTQPRLYCAMQLANRTIREETDRQYATLNPHYVQALRRRKDSMIICCFRSGKSTTAPQNDDLDRGLIRPISDRKFLMVTQNQ